MKPNWLTQLRCSSLADTASLAQNARYLAVFSYVCVPKVILYNGYTSIRLYMLAHAETCLFMLSIVYKRFDQNSISNIGH